MIENGLVFPFADERRNTAKTSVFLPDATLLREFAQRENLEVSLIREFHKNQKDIPRSEISITLDNRDRLFDVTNADSAIYSLSKKAYCETFFSSVNYGSEEAFVKKCRYFYDSFSEKDTSISLKFTDAVSHEEFESKYMTYVFAEIGTSGSATAREILEGVRLETGYNIEYEVSDEINNKTTFSKSSFVNDTSGLSIKAGLFDMATRLTSSFRSPVYFVIDDDGKLTFKKQQTEIAATITTKHFKTLEFIQGNGCLISRITDRGNILYQLGDIIEVVNGSKTFRTEIYRINYKLSSNGSLSSEWEGVIL